MSFPCPNPKFSYNGKIYETAAELKAVLSSLPLSTASKYVPSVTSIPNAPFIEKTDAWAGLAMKRALRYAAENGFDKVAWTTGEQQAERYDLSKHIDQLAWGKNADGTYNLTGLKSSPYQPTKTVISEKSIPADKVEDYVGKDIAKKIMETAGHGALSGIDLKVGGQGMKGFYDQILPSFLNKYAKKWGGKVGKSAIDVGNYRVDKDDSASEKGQYRLREWDSNNIISRHKTGEDAWAEAERLGSVPIHSIDITPAMRESVMQGQPLFLLKQTDKFSEKADEIKQKILAAAQRMNPDVKVKFVDKILATGPGAVASGGTEGVEAAGVYRTAQKLIEISLNMDRFDPEETAYHELWHSLENLLLPEEVRLLRKEFPGGKYSGLSGEIEPYEHAALAAGEFMRGKANNYIPAVRRIFTKIRNFITAIGNILNGYGFRTVDDIFEKAYSGKIYARSEMNGAVESEPSLPRDSSVEVAEPNENDIFSGGARGNFGASGIDAIAERNARNITEENKDEALQYALGSLKDFVKKYKSAPELDTGVDLDYFRNTMVHPRTIAKKFKEFTPVWMAAETQYEIRDRIATEMGQILEPYFALPDKENVNKALEIGRLEGKVIQKDDNSIVNTIGDTELSKKGEKITLNPAEMTAYRSVRQGMDAMLSNMHALTLFRAGFDPDKETSPKTIDDVKNLAAMEKDGDRKQVLNALAETLQSIQDARMRGYVPFTRFGNYAIVVTDKNGDVTHRKHYEIGAVGRYTGAARLKMLAERESLALKYPKSKGYEVSEPILLNSKSALQRARLDLNALDSIATAAGRNDQYYEGFREDIEREQQKLGFKSHLIRSYNTSGYSTDFERVISEYIYKGANYLARQASAPSFSNAIKAIDAVKMNRLREYAQDLQKYLNEPREEYQALRNTVFMFYLAANPSSAAVNLTQVQAMTAPYLAQYTGPMDVSKELGVAYKDAIKMIRPGGADGGVLKFDIDTAPEDVREALKEANARGDLVPQMSIEQMSIAQGRQRLFRNQRKFLGKVTKHFYEMYSSAERVNRIVTYIAAYRIGQNADVRAKAAKIHSNNPLWKAHGEYSPDKFARWVIDETHFKVGKINRPRLFRGPGAALLQFKGYSLMALEAYAEMYQNWRNNPDPEVRRAGRAAFAASMAMLILFSGLQGLPFAEDMKDLAEVIHHKATGVDVDIDKEMREISSDVLQATGMSKENSDLGAMFLMRGFARGTGIDISGRTSMGNILPSLSGEKAIEDIGGLPYSFLVKRPLNALEAYKNGAPWYDIASKFTPALFENSITAYSWAHNGVLSGGDTLIPAADVSRETVLLKALGFTSSEVSASREYFYMAKRSQKKVSDLQSRYYTRLSRAIMENDLEKINAIHQEMREFNEGREAADRIILDPSYLRREIKEQMMGIKAFKPSKKGAGEYQKTMGMNPYRKAPENAELKTLLDSVGPLNKRNIPAYQRVLDESESE